MTGQDVGRSRGGPTTKIHVAVDRRGLRSTPGQQAGHAPKLLEDLETGTTVIADKAYDTDAILRHISEAGAVAAIPSKASRKKQRPLDRELYAERNIVERFFCQGVQAHRHALR